MYCINCCKEVAAQAVMCKERKMTRSIQVALVACILILGGCITYGTKFDPAQASKIERGKTTKAEIQSWFGKPLNVTSYGGGEMWVYKYEKRMAAALTKEIYGAGTYGSQARPELMGGAALTVMFNSKGVVSDYTLTQAGS